MTLKRKSVMISLIILSCAKSTFSQVNIGVIAGQGYSNFGLRNYENIRIYYDGFFNFEPAQFTRHGFKGGFFVNFPLWQSFHLQAEILYSERGSGGSTGPRTEWLLNYVEVPILVKSKLSLASTSSIFVLGGIETDFNVNSKYRIFNPSGDSFDYKIGNVNAIDLGVVLGGGLSQKLSKYVFSLEVRYIFGLSTLLDSGVEFTDAPDTLYLADTELNARNRQIAILANIAIEI
jgi:hypothetical protein